MIEYRFNNTADRKWYIEDTYNMNLWHLAEWWSIKNFNYRINNVIYKEYDDDFKDAVEKEITWNILKNG